VLDKHEHVEPIKDFLQGVKPMPAVFDQHYVKRLEGKNVKSGKNKKELAEALRKDIRDFKAKNKCDRLVMVWCASTEIFIVPGPAHESLRRSRRRWRPNDPTIAPSMLYAYAAVMEGVPFANGAPNLSCDFPALENLAKEKHVAIGGKDFKTGQTMLKTVLSPMFKARMLGVAGWYSTNILGNRDGEVLDDPESFKTKEESKLGVLEYILQPQVYPELYANMYHKVRSTTTRRVETIKRGGTTLISSGGWATRCRSRLTSSARFHLAAPLVWISQSSRPGPACRSLGIQEWLSFYFKSPQAAPGLYPEHDLSSSSPSSKHAALDGGRAGDYPPWGGVLRIWREVGGRKSKWYLPLPTSHLTTEPYVA
jgi:myo-inositol-1-phosphate synthase